MPQKLLHLHDLGLKEYKSSWDFQEQIFQETVDIKIQNRKLNTSTPTQDHLIFVEHPPVYTLGKSGKLEHLLLSEDALIEKGVSFFKTNRGGDITFHGPGQLVGYPILDLDHHFTDIHRYLRTLEEVVIQTLLTFGIQATRSSGETGVWLDVDTPFARKICAMGVKASRWVTMHGFALNVTPDMQFFEYIVPCGIRGKSVTSMALELEKAPTVEEVKQVLLQKFCEQFNFKVVC